MERKSKCRWVGTVGTLHDHLTTCTYTLIQCPHQCEDKNGEIKSFMKKDLNRHLPYCPNRDYECSFCGEKGSYTTITQVHDDICEKKVITCPNTECLQGMQRQHLSDHLQFVCEHAVVACKHQAIGCNVELKRKDMAAHEQDDSYHFRMALETVTQLKNHCSVLEEKSRAQRESTEKILSKTFKLTGYQNYKDDNKTFLSPSFYTGPKGYLVQIEVYANGYRDGAGTHMSA